MEPGESSAERVGALCSGPFFMVHSLVDDERFSVAGKN
jgi:hypothetical protein